MRYPVAQPDLSGNELEYVSEAVRSSWISAHGKYLERLEASCREFLGTPHAMVCANGTVALHLALLALDIRPGDEVIVPTLTYVASANAIRYCGATPVFADSLPDTWCLDPRSVRSLISPKTKAIMPVHLYGQTCDMTSLQDLADEHDLWIVEDAAEALGAEHDGSKAGTLGDVATFSFFGNKLVTTGEGGLVVCRDKELHEKIWLLAHQGMDPNRRYWHPIVGYNYRMTNLAAAVGVAQMERVDAFLDHRERLAGWYHGRLKGISRLTLPHAVSRTRHAYWMYGVLVDDASVRDPLMAKLAERGIETRPFFFPIHEFPPYADAPTDRQCPTATDLARRGLCLPSYHGLTERDVDVIARELRECLARTLATRTVSTISAAA